MSNFQKLGRDRQSLNIARATTKASNTVGDITNGSVVTITGSGDANIGSRATGAILIGTSGSIDVSSWNVDDGKLTLTSNTPTVDFTFWVF